MSVRKLRERARKRRAGYNRDTNAYDLVYNDVSGKKYGKLYVFYRQLLRDLIAPSIRKYKSKWFKENRQINGLYRCEFSKKEYPSNEFEADHYDIKFRDLALMFAKENNIEISWTMFKSKKLDQKLEATEINDSLTDYQRLIASIPIHKGKTKRPINLTKKQYAKLLDKQIQTRSNKAKNNIYIDKSKQYYKEFKDPSLNDKWIQFHNKHAKLRMIHWRINQDLK